jgi:COP9 signalosome complex subunit 1
MQSTALKTAKAYEKEALDRIRRMSIASADLEVKGSKRGIGASSLGAVTDSLYEDVSVG